MPKLCMGLLVFAYLLFVDIVSFGIYYRAHLINLPKLGKYAFFEAYMPIERISLDKLTFQTDILCKKRLLIFLRPKAN